MLRRCFVGGAVRSAFNNQLRSTTILSVRKGDRVVLMGDRQVTLGERIIAKSSAKKLRRAGDHVMVGFAGSTADAITLLEKLEAKLTEFPDQLLRACVELAKEWRSDKFLRKLEASLIVCDKNETLEIDGQGNVITPEPDGIVAIGSGGTYAKAAARALIDVDGYDAETIARKAIKIATDIDVFSNGNFDIDTIEVNTDAKPEGSTTETPAATTTSDATPATPSETAAPTESAEPSKDEKTASRGPIVFSS